MSDALRYQLDGRIATIAIDDGKMNALSFEVLAALHGALDRAAADRAIVVLTGRAGVLSAGFDLKVLRAGGPDAARLVIAGFELALRLFGHPEPVIVACPGHAIAMGAFLTLTADYRLGTLGAFKLGANEVAIGLTMPYFAAELCRQRLAPTHLQRVVLHAEMFTPEDAVTAGFLDRAVSAAELASAARAVAAQLALLDRGVHAATKLRLRAAALTSLRAAIDADVVALGGGISA